MRSVLRLDLTHLSDLVQTQQDRPVHGPDDVTAAVAGMDAASRDRLSAVRPQ